MGGVVNLIGAPCGFRTALLRFEDATDKTLQSPKERLVSQRPAGGPMPADLSEFLFRYRALQKGVPIRDHRQQGGHFYQPIVPARQGEGVSP